MPISGTPTTIVEVVNALNTSLAGMGVVNTGFGKSALAAMDRAAPPGVVWVPTRDRFEAVEDHMQSSLTQGPRWIRKRMAGFTVHLWASITNPASDRQEDFSPLDDLIEKVVSALQQNLPGGYEIEGGEHIDLESNDTELASYGRGYEMSVYIAMPIRMQNENVSTVVLAGLPMTIGDGNQGNGQVGPGGPGGGQPP